MSNHNLGTVQIFSDEFSDTQILKKIANDQKDEEEPFRIVNIGDIFQKHVTWLKKMPRIIPHYAVKCNPDINVIKVIAALGGNFDCASKSEIIEVMNCNVPANRIIFANPMKFCAHIEYAKQVGVEMMTADTEYELKKIQKIFPSAKIILRIRCDSAITLSALGKKFGCDPGEEAVNLLKTAISLGLDVNGFSFHVGSPCGEISSICRGIMFCKNLVEIARSLGCQNVNIIDIGGGIPGKSDFVIDEFSEEINKTLGNVDTSIQIIAEPGRYYVTSAFSSAARIIGKKLVMNEDSKSFMYYVSDGVFTTFIHELLNISERDPVALDESKRKSTEKYQSTIWGPTCDSFDCIVENHLLPEYEIGEWLGWHDVGAYSTCFASTFNGFSLPKCYPVVRKSKWEEILAVINNRIGEV